jgi:tetratricopeptide (TPR) repeat protein
MTIGNLASVYRRLGRLDEAERLVNRALDLAPDSAALFCTRAEIALHRGHEPAAHRALDEAEARDPLLARVFDLRGRTCWVQERRDEAIDAVQRALELDPMSVEAHLLLANMLRAVGRTAECAAVLDALEELDPGNAQARQLRK